MARSAEQLRTKDVTFWGVFAMAIWAVAIVAANVSALIPVAVLGGLHASRLEGASLNQLRSAMEELQAQSAALRQDNTVLMQRFALSEQQSGEMTRRVGALELSMPRLVEAVNAGPSTDGGTVTGSIDTPGAVTTFDTEGGTVAFTTTPLPGQAQPAKVAPQPMPQALTADVTPDAGAFGIALGPPIDADEGETAWQSMNARVGTLLIGLGPILAHVEGGGGRRLVAGPIASEADARELCGRMAKVGIACASVPFIGDPLPLLN